MKRTTTRAQHFPTAIQDIALNCVFAVMGELRFNRTLPEYEAFAAKLPPLKVLHWRVNEFLEQLHQRSEDSGTQLPELCRFKAGDERILYEPYPRTISHETIRLALIMAGFRVAQERGKSL